MIFTDKTSGTAVIARLVAGIQKIDNDIPDDKKEPGYKKYDFRIAPRKHR